MTEREKMLAGEPYDPFDPDLLAGRRRAQATVIAFNDEPDEDRRIGDARGAARRLRRAVAGRAAVLLRLRDQHPTSATTPSSTPNAVFLDCAEITVGDHARLGPGVQVLAADHPREPELRAADIELAFPVTHRRPLLDRGRARSSARASRVGEHSIIGAGSVVTRDIPARVMAAGNPAG